MNGETIFREPGFVRHSEIAKYIGDMIVVGFMDSRNLPFKMVNAKERDGQKSEESSECRYTEAEFDHRDDVSSLKNRNEILKSYGGNKIFWEKFRKEKLRGVGKYFLEK